MSVHSMTGYAHCQCETPAGKISLELRSVNGRYLDLSFKMADEFRHLETTLRERVVQTLARGKVECRLSVQASTQSGLKLRPEVLAQLRDLELAVLQASPEARPLSTADILRWPGILEQAEFTAEQWQAWASSLMQQALEELTLSRQREGARLSAAIAERVTAMRALLAEAEIHIPAALQAHQERLSERIQTALTNLDPKIDAATIADKVRQELMLYGLRTDVSEELTRLGIHLDELTRILQTKGQAGKRLDFLMQELNREANTLGSKSPTVPLTNVAMSLKVLIEQVREQVQNLE